MSHHTGRWYNWPERRDRCSDGVLHHTRHQIYTQVANTIKRTETGWVVAMVANLQGQATKGFPPETA